MSHKKWTITFATSVIMLLLSVGVFAQDSVVVFIRTGPEADGMRAVAEQFTAETGIEVEFMEVGRSGYFGTMTTQLVSGTDEFDIVATNSAFVAQLAASGATEPLTGFIADAPDAWDLEDIIFTYSYNDDVYALPFDVSTHFLYYRSDLIEEPPQTWDEYGETAEDFTRALVEDSPTTYGASFTALAGPEQPKVFYSVMWSMGGEIIQEGESQFDTDGAVAAASYYRELVEAELLPPDVSSWGFPNVLDALRTGEVAMAGPYWNAAYLQIVNSDSPFADDIAITLVPGMEQDDGTILRTPFQHGWSFVMNSNSERKDAAWQFLQYATSTEGALIYAQNGGTPALRSVLQDESLEPRVYYDLMLESLEIARDEPAVPYYSEMHETINQALTEVLTTGNNTTDIMANLDERVQDLIDQFN